MSYLNPGRLGLMGAPTYPMLRDATQATLFEILDANAVPFDLNKADNILVMKDTGSRILFRPVDEFERLRGTNLAWFGLDELTYTHEEAWLRLEGRLRDPKANRLCGCAVWTPKGYDWVYRKFVAERSEDYELIIAAPFENRFLLDRVPDFYKRLSQSYDETFYKQEVLGTYLNLSGGLVYSAFTREQNVVDVELDPRVPLLWALDFNVDPMSSLIAQIVDRRLQVLGEIVIRRGTTQQACEEFLKRFPNYRGEIGVYGDASGNAQQTTGASDYEMIREYFLVHSPAKVKYRVPRSNPLVRDRINLTNSKLQSASGNIWVLISPGCHELIKDLEQVSFKENTMEIDKDRDRQRTHVSDALGYLLWQESGPNGSIGEQTGRIL